jgi:hypothetical protein
VVPSCSRELDSEDAQPYFVWDEPMTVARLRTLLADAEEDVRVRWIARVLRDARFDDVWRFITVDDLVRSWPQVASYLGRRRSFWTWMLDRWRADGLVP